MTKKKVDGHPDLWIDERDGVICNRQSTERSRYRIAKKQARMNIDSQLEIQELKKTVKEVDNLKAELAEMKDLLRQILDK